MENFFTTLMIIKAIKRLEYMKSINHAGLQAKHLIYSQESLRSLIIVLFNRALAEGFLSQGTMHTMIPIHKGGGAMIHIHIGPLCLVTHWPRSMVQ